MTTRIAHLSDLHFGNSFKIALWQALLKVVIDFDPHLLIVSGDLVDHPSPMHLLAAKCELRDLAAAASAQLCVVPGNHDLYPAGTRMMMSRSDWFERIFHDDTTEAEAELERQHGERPGFSATYLNQPVVTPEVANWFRRTILNRPPSGFRAHLPPPPGTARPPLVEKPNDIPILLALLDSNSEDQTIGTATGSVAQDDLLKLGEALKAVATPYVARIAVVHHHLLPIAFVSGRIVGAEPLMVLHNAGTVLSILRDHRFDLVLHGHKHRQQFARLDLDPRDADGYPIAIAAAGSAALASTDNERGNSCNLIRIAENGRIHVASLFYGDAAAPDLNGEGDRVRNFHEPIAAAKRRAFVRARQRHGLLCDRWRRDFVVSENGDLAVNHTIQGLRLAEVDASYRKRPHDLFPPPYGKLVASELYLDRESRRRRYNIELEAPQADGTRRCWVTLPHSPDSGRTADYVLHHGHANSLAMTRWEAEQRWELDHGSEMPEEEPAEEWVGSPVTHPIEELTVSLKMPPSLASVKPYVACRRHRDFPNYATDKYLDAVMLRDSWQDDDSDMQTEEEQRLQFDPIDCRWKITIPRPMVGYNYQLRWELPKDQVDRTIEGDVLQWQDLLLEAASTTPAQCRTRQYLAAFATFQAYREVFERLLQWGGAGEKRGVEVFVYNRSTLALVPAFSYRSWVPTPLPAGFVIALGDGIAGAAFQQCRTIPWSKRARHQPYIMPVTYPLQDGEEGTDFATMFAVPVYHPDTADAMQPSPWSAIGVVSFSSSSPASKIAGMCTNDPADESVETLREVRALAQTLVHDILKDLASP